MILLDLQIQKILLLKCIPSETGGQTRDNKPLCVAATSAVSQPLALLHHHPHPPPHSSTALTILQSTNIAKNETYSTYSAGNLSNREKSTWASDLKVTFE